MQISLRAPLRARLDLLAALVLGLSVAPAWANPPVSRTPGAAVRLIDAGSVDGRPQLGLEIALEPGWKTYWRAPGDTGIPPAVDWSKSKGVAAFDLRFPAPARFGEEGVRSIGYTAPVILPIDVRLADPRQPATLDLEVQIGICHDICVPVFAHLEATLAATAPVDAAALARLAQARAEVPKAAEKGVAPWIVSLGRDPAANDAAVLVEVKMPDDPTQVRDVLVEGPTGEWALPLPERVGAAGARETWRFDLDGIPRGATVVGSELRFTLRAADHVVEQKLTLDAAAVTP
jgi:DsbC/DsbD-like thiol-disulfide interchange protein